MSELLVAPVLALHLVCVNIASAGPCVAIWFDTREAQGNQFAGGLGRFLTWASTTLLVVGSGLGLLLGYLKWNQEYRALLEVFQRRIVFGAWEILFSLVLMLICATWWSIRGRRSRPERYIRNFLLLLAATNLLYHFPFLFVVLSETQQGSLPQPDGLLDAAHFRQMIGTPSVLAKVVHIWLASFAVTGIAMLARAIWNRSDPDSSNHDAIRGGRLALMVTIAQLPVGIWLLLQLPRTTQHALLGGDPIAACLLVASVVLSLGLMHVLAAISFGDPSHSNLRRAVASMLLIVFMMTAVLQRT